VLGPLDPVVLYTMSWSTEFAVPCVPPPVGAALRLLAASTRAQTAVELGTGLGVSGLWLLQGLPDSAVLTTIDVDPDHQAMARQAFDAAGAGTGRTRLITGRAERVLDRLVDHGYDLVFVDLDDDPQWTADEGEQPPLWLTGAARILRPGGLLVLHQPTTAAASALSEQTWSPAPLGPQLLAATRR
jgi:predicted O-methyltransferase YrrM